MDGVQHPLELRVRAGPQSAVNKMRVLIRTRTGRAMRQALNDDVQLGPGEAMLVIAALSAVMWAALHLLVGALIP